MILQLVITILGWIALIVVGTNLIGMFVRGLVLVSSVEAQLSKEDEIFKKATGEFYNPKLERKANFVSLVLIIIYLLALFYFWNMGVVLAATMVMVARIPDLLWEIKHGKQEIKNMPMFYMLTLLITFAALPVLWYSLY